MNTMAPNTETARRSRSHPAPLLIGHKRPARRRQGLLASLIALYAGCLAGSAVAADGSTDFSHALGNDYTALSHAEYLQGDERDGATYAARAAAAGRGQATTPEDPLLRDAFLKEHYKSELNTAREHLLKSLDADGRTRAPAAAARAQSSFDCWLEQAAEDIQPDDIAACRRAFMTALAVVDDANGQRVTAEVTPPPVEPASPPASPPPPLENYRVFFGFDSARLGKTALATLAEIKTATEGSTARHLTVIGHASTIGSESHNQALSQRRAEAVKAELVRLGIPADSIDTIARGEQDLLVPTADGVREPRNRQVYITLE